MTLEIKIYEMTGGKNMLEKIINWLKQRRIWAAVLSAVAVYGAVTGYAIVPEICTALAGALALTSYVAPKK